MFITREAYKSPMAALFLCKGEDGWSAIELALQQTWFLVHLEPSDASTGTEVHCGRTLLLFDFPNIERFILSSPDSTARLLTVHIVTPGHVNGSDSWKMDQLRAVWQGREPVNGSEIPMDIFETVCGKRYPASFSALSIEELAADKLKFEFSH